MKIMTVAGEIMPVIGTIGFLGLWFYQQNEIEKNLGELRKISESRSIFQTYQSNNAVFNAVEELAGKNEPSATNIRGYQIYNYELGLFAIEDVLSDSEKVGLPPSQNNVTAIRNDPVSAINTTQKRLELLQQKLDDKEQRIKDKSAQSKRNYFWLYISFSVLSIAGAVLRIIDKV